jgi:hypothetical protein
MITGKELTDGTRGRSLCIAVAIELGDEVEQALLDLESDYAASYARLDQLTPDAGKVVELVNALGKVTDRWTWSSSDPMRFFPALGVAVDSAMPWQEPWIRDAITAMPAVRTALIPLAKFILASPGAAWWHNDAALSQQWATLAVIDDHPGRLASPGPAKERLDTWKECQDGEEEWFRGQTQEGAMFGPDFGGAWWSIPFATDNANAIGAFLPSSTRRLTSLGAISLALGEDGDGLDQAFLCRVHPSTEVRVYEVHTKGDWAGLVEWYPFSAKWSRRAVWKQSTGRNEHWFLPDFAAVSNDFDGIHLSVAGYLSAAGEVIDLQDGATMIAGWGPDETYWLTDDFTVEPKPEKWERIGDMHEWRHNENLLLAASDSER